MLGGYSSRCYGKADRSGRWKVVGGFLSVAVVGVAVDVELPRTSTADRVLEVVVASGSAGD
jgi:hypothetical protein